MPGTIVAPGRNASFARQAAAPPSPAGRLDAIARRIRGLAREAELLADEIREGEK